MRPIFSIFFLNKVTVGPVNSIVNSVICLKKKKMREEKKKKIESVNVDPNRYFSECLDSRFGFMFVFFFFLQRV